MNYLLFLISVAFLGSHVHSFAPKVSRTNPVIGTTAGAIYGTSKEREDGTDMEDRRSMFKSVASGMVGSMLMPWAANAKVEGYAPPKKELSEDYRQGTAALGGSEEDAPIPREAYKKQASGLVYADVRSGTGSEVAREGSRVNLQWVLRKGNGYFVDSSATNDSVPFIFTVGDGKAIAGVDEGVRGMKLGGVRRLLIPVSMAYVEGLEDDKPGPVPVGFGPRQQMRRVQTVRKDVPGEYVFLEIQLTRMR